MSENWTFIASVTRSEVASPFPSTSCPSCSGSTPPCGGFGAGDWAEVVRYWCPACGVDWMMNPRRGVFYERTGDRGLRAVCTPVPS